MTFQDNLDHARELAYIKGRLDELVELNKVVVSDHGPRIRSLENGRAYVMGGAGLAGFLAALIPGFIR